METSTPTLIEKAIVTLVTVSMLVATFGYSVASAQTNTVANAATVDEIVNADDYQLDTHGDVLRLYRAFFNREPDASGARYWIDVRRTRSLIEIAEFFTGSVEYANIYAGTSNREFLEAVYLNVLGRRSDNSGFVYWLDLLEGTNNSGNNTGAQIISRGEVVRWVTASIEFKTTYPYEPDETATSSSTSPTTIPQQTTTTTVQATTTTVQGTTTTTASQGTSTSTSQPGGTTTTTQPVSMTTTQPTTTTTSMPDLPIPVGPANPDGLAMNGATAYIEWLTECFEGGVNGPFTFDDYQNCHADSGFRSVNIRLFQSVCKGAHNAQGQWEQVEGTVLEPFYAPPVMTECFRVIEGGEIPVWDVVIRSGLWWDEKEHFEDNPNSHDNWGWSSQHFTDRTAKTTFEPLGLLYGR